MKNLITYAFLILFSVLTIINCKKLDVPKATPLCIKIKIKEMQSDEVRNPPGSVWQYDYNGQTVYYIPSYCCDMTSELYDSKCNLICRPDGGITGAGDGKCPDFLSNRKNERLIWQDDRK